MELRYEEDLAPYLAATSFLDFAAEPVRAFAVAHTGGAVSAVEKAVRLFYAVRDGIAYDLLDNRDLSAKRFRASDVLLRGRGFCIDKAVLFAAACRYHGIPSRLCFADVVNHLASSKVLELMEPKDHLFVWHGYAEVLLNGTWIKCTPAFDRNLCERHGVRPIEWDGMTDAIFHEFDIREQKHMEYVLDRGTFADVPHAELVAALHAAYPRFY